MPKITRAETKPGKYQHRITIPKEIMKMKGWNAGDNLIFSLQMNGEIALQRVPK